MSGRTFSLGRAAGVFATGAAVTLYGMVLPSAAASADAVVGNRLNPGQMLNVGQSLSSPNGEYVLTMQTDGNLVEYEPGHIAIWATSTEGHGGAVLFEQNDGNVVVVAPGNHPVWSAGTEKRPGTVLIVQDDGNVVAYAPGNVAIWASNTGGAVPTPQPQPGHFPSSFNIAAAASWARSHATIFPSDAPQDDPCTYFVSTALAAAGMPTDSDWYSNTDAVELYINGGHQSRQWNGATALTQRLVNAGWAQMVELDRDSPTGGPRGAVATPGDLVYYEWNGVESVGNVHMAIVTSVDGSAIEVTEQNSAHTSTVDRPISVSFQTHGHPNLSVVHPGLRTFLIHWL